MRRRETTPYGGFTLAELLVVVAILAVLVAVAFPLFRGVLEKASATQCVANRTMIAHALGAELIQRPDIHSATAIRYLATKMIEDAKAESSAYFATPCVCEKGGRYTYRLGGIVCDVVSHGGIIGSGGQEITLEDHMNATLNDMYADTTTLSEKDFLDKYGIRPVDIRNDTVRKYLFNEVYGGSWPPLSDAFKDKNGLSGDYNIQPYILGTNTGSSQKDIIIFAHTNQSEAANWYTDLYFSFEHDAWFRRDDPISATEFKTNSTLEADIKNNPNIWTELKN